MHINNKILIIDDDVLSLFLIRRVFERMEFPLEIDTAKNGREGLEKIYFYNDINSWPDIIFLDSHMPVMDGLGFMTELNSLISAKERKTRIILLTNSLNNKDIEAYYQLGISEFHAKPLKERDARKIYEKYCLSKEGSSY